MKKAFISQPMSGISDDEVRTTKERIVKLLEDRGIEVVHNITHGNELFDNDNIRNEGYHPQIYRLGYDLIELAKCDMLYCASGWEEKRGCCLEEYAARIYGLEIIYEEIEGEHYESTKF